MNPCLNNPCGYCQGEPSHYQADEEALAYDSREHEYPQSLWGHRCRDDYHTCGKYLTHTQLCALKKEQPQGTGTVTPGIQP